MKMIKIIRVEEVDHEGLSPRGLMKALNQARRRAKAGEQILLEIDGRYLEPEIFAHTLTRDQAKTILEDMGVLK